MLLRLVIFQIVLSLCLDIVRVDDVRLVAVVYDQVAELLVTLPAGLLLHLGKPDLLLGVSPPEPAPLCLPLDLHRGVRALAPLGAALAPVQVIVKVGLLAEAAPTVWTHDLLSVVSNFSVRRQVPSINDYSDIIEN